MLTVTLAFSLILSSSLVAAPAVTQAASYPKGAVAATIAKEVDGDSIYVRLHGKKVEIRMLLIDTPETHDPRYGVEPYGPTASAFAKKELPVGSHIRLQEGVKGHRYDKYHRLLAFIYTARGHLYNYDVIRAGYARVAYVYKPNTQHLSSLRAAQNAAKKKKLGIWKIKGYVTTGGYRYQVHTLKKPTTAYRISGGLTVSRGQYASVTVAAKKGTKATIKVYYSSGASKAKGLGTKYAGSNGKITWKWRVGTNTKKGKYRVVIKIGGKSITKYLYVK